MVRRPIASTLDSFSSRLVKFHDLPSGTEIRLYRKGAGKKVRSDFTVKRKKRITRKNIERLDNSSTVIDFINHIRDLLSTDIDKRSLEIRLYKPNGDRINGNTLLGTVREFDPKVTEEDHDEILDLFITLLEDHDLENIHPPKAQALYNQLNRITDYTLDKSLLKNRKDII